MCVCVGGCGWVGVGEVQGWAKLMQFPLQSFTMKVLQGRQVLLETDVCHTSVHLVPLWATQDLSTATSIQSIVINNSCNLC